MDVAAEQPLLELHGATVVLGGTRILDGLTLTIAAGEHTAILGPNGAGKSTFIKLLTLQQYPLPAANGTPPIRVMGRDRWDVFALRVADGDRLTRSPRPVRARQLQRHDHRARRGRCPAFSRARGSSRISRSPARCAGGAARRWRRVGAAHLAAATLDTMSTGEARRVLIARALVHQPRALVLDEPTRGLDLVARHEFLERIRAVAQQGTTILLVTHHVDEIIPEIESRHPAAAAGALPPTAPRRRC